MSDLCKTTLALDPEYRCQHSDSDRCLTGTWVTTELQKAVDMGYQIDQIYEIWHFPQSSQTLFKAYIDTFLKIKQEASGFPLDCESKKQKQAHIHDIYQREGIKLDLLEVEKNPVKRIIAKLFLNCLWGEIRSKNPATEISIPDRGSRISTIITRYQLRGQRGRTLTKFGGS